MERDGEETRTDEARIIARLRRRPTTSRPLSASEFSHETSDAANDEQQTPVDETNDSRSNRSRAEALKRLVSSQTPKETMSALSPTLRDLRREFQSETYAAFGSTTRDESVKNADPRLDLIESELDAVDKSSVRTTEPTPDKTSYERVKSKGLDEEPLRPRVETASQPRREDVAKNVATNDLLVVSALKKGYVKAKKLIPVLQGVDMQVKEGELVAVVGQSGSGKSTLLHLMGTLDVPDSGTIHFDGQRIDNLPGAQRDVLRNRFIGMIFQFYHLIPEMTTLENVLAPLMIRDSIFTYLRMRSSYVKRAKEMLDLVGMSHRLRHRPNELSGGEMQRVSIARALITEPRVLLADEPTGNLDSKASIGILKLMRLLNEEQKLTIVMVTHDMGQAQDADRAIRLVDGLVVPE